MRKLSIFCIVIAAIVALCACNSKEQTSTIPQDHTTEFETNSVMEEEIVLTTELTEDDLIKESNSSIIETYINNEFVNCKKGYCIVKNESGLLYGLIDMNGELVIDFQYDDLYFLETDTGVYLEAVYDGNHGVLDAEGNEIVPVTYYSSVQVVNQNYFMCRQRSENLARIDYDFYNLSGEKCGNYEITEEGANEISSREFSIGGELLGLNISSFVRTEKDELPFRDVFRIITVKGDVLLEETAHYLMDVTYIDNMDCYALMFSGGHIEFVSDEGKVIKSYDEVDVSGWDFDGNVVQGVYSQFGYLTTINIVNLDTKEIISSFDTYHKKFVTIDKTDELLLIDKMVYDKTNTCIMTLPGEGYLLNDKVIYRDDGVNNYKYVDKNGTPVYEDRYYGCYDIYDVDNHCYFLQNGNGEICMISEAGDLIVDYGIFTVEGDNIYYQGRMIEDFYIDEGYISMISGDMLITIIF